MRWTDRRLALLLTQLALALIVGNELFQLTTSNARLSDLLAKQAPNEEAIKRVDAQLESLAQGTQRLAQQGNAEAAKIVDTLAQSGVHINASGARK